MDDIMNIQGIECYEKGGTAYLKLETVARGLGFTTVATSGNECVRWNRVEQYLAELGFPNKLGKDDFIPENIFYRLAMKAKNEAAEKFQAKIADEVIPAIRKHGAYMTPATIEELISNPDTIIQLATAFRETAKQLNVKEKVFIRFLLEKKYIYRDKKGKLLPYADRNTGLFEVKECFNEKTQWSGTQTLITPKGRETFRLLCQGV